MTFKEWLDSKTVEERKNFHEYFWVYALCKEAWETSATHTFRTAYELGFKEGKEEALTRKPDWRTYAFGE